MAEADAGEPFVVEQPGVEADLDGLREGLHKLFVFLQNLPVLFGHVDLMKNEVVYDLLADRDYLLAVAVLGASQHGQELEENLPLGFGGGSLVEVVLQEFPDEVQVQGPSQLEDSNQAEECLQILDVLLDELKQYFGEEDDLVFLVHLIPAVGEGGGVPELDCVIELFGDFVPEGGEALEPAVVFLGQDVDDLEEDGVLLLGLVFAELGEGLVDVAGLPGEFLAEGEGVVEGDDLEEVLEVEFPFLPLDEDALARQFLAHGVEDPGEGGLDVHLDGVLSELGGEVVADVADVLEDEDDRVDGVVGGPVVVIGVG